MSDLAALCVIESLFVIPHAAETVVTDFASLDPSPEISELIRSYKAEIRQLAGDQIYLNEPPHMTAYLARFPAAADLSSCFVKLAKQIEAFTIELAGFFVFDADPLTGSRTLVINFSEATNAALRHIQQQIAFEMRQLRDPLQTRERYQHALPQFTAPQRSALSEIGFPYFGDGWHPHFTIASIQTKDWPVVADQLLTDPPRGDMVCRSITHYRVEQNESRKLQSYLMS